MQLIYDDGFPNSGTYFTICTKMYIIIQYFYFITFDNDDRLKTAAIRIILESKISRLYIILYISILYYIRSKIQFRLLSYGKTFNRVIFNLQYYWFYTLYTLHRRWKKYRKIHIIVIMITIKPQYLHTYDIHHMYRYY